MPLLLTTAQLEFSKLLDKNHPQFVGFGNFDFEVADKWADVLVNYSQNIVPATSPAALNTAKNIASNMLIGISFGTFLIELPTAYQVFANAIASGMTGGVAAPPPAPIDFSSIIALPLNINNTPTIINIFATLTDTWFRTGTFTPTGGSTINWN